MAGIKPFIEQMKLDQEHQRLRFDWDQARREPVFQFAEIALRSMLLLNGGAAISVLTFAGNADKIGMQSKVSVLGSMVLVFGAGAAFAVLTAMLAYLAQVVYASLEPHDRATRIGNRIRLACLGAAFLSLVAFVLGLGLSSWLFGR